MANKNLRSVVLVFIIVFITTFFVLAINDMKKSGGGEDKKPLKCAPISSGKISTECSASLKAKNYKSVDEAVTALREKYPTRKAPCTFNKESDVWSPDSKPVIPGSTDTSDLGCYYGNPYMWNSDGKGSLCCGWKPHFNWIVSTCENEKGNPFCAGLPECLKSEGVQLNYVAAYQYDGEHFILMDESTCGDINENGVSGNFNLRTGWEKHKQSFNWVGGDWPTKFAPSCKPKQGKGGPRGITPPGGMWVLSAENFYYGGFYMLSQLGINLEKHRQAYNLPTNCWVWELDPVEGTFGWSPGKNAPGNVNQLYFTSNAQASGCMPSPYTAVQLQGGQQNLSFPKVFKDYCEKNPGSAGCTPWKNDIMVGGGAVSTNRFENGWKIPYVFVVVMDGNGYWTYRWIPNKDTGATGWPGIGRYKADRILVSHPKAIIDPAGLTTNISASTPEAVIFEPGQPSESACRTASGAAMDWQFAAHLIGSIAWETGENKPGGRLEGAQNWWNDMCDTGQYQNYPLTISGIPYSEMPSKYNCNNTTNATCNCIQKR